MRPPRLLVTTLVAGLLGAGCLVQVDHVKDPSQAFREARAEAARFQGRPGPARQVNVLAYDPDDHELVRVSLPMWLCRKLDHHTQLDFDGDGEERAARAVKRHVRLEDLEKAGLGVLLEVEEGDGEQVLIWLR